MCPAPVRGRSQADRRNEDSAPDRQDLRTARRQTEANRYSPGDYVLVTEAEPVYIYGAVVSPNGVYLRER